MKETILKRLEHKKFRKMPPFGYRMLVTFVANIVAKKFHLEIDRGFDPKKYNKKQFILLGNHVSRSDYLFAMKAMTASNPMNFVAAHNEYYRSHLQGIFNIGSIVPKKQYVADMLMLKAALMVIKDGGSLCLFPEGVSSVMGTQQPIVKGTGKLLKHFKLPILLMETSGSYLSNSKFDKIERKGKVKIKLTEFLMQEDLERLPADEIDDLINAKLNRDDFEWNKKEQHSYFAKNPARNVTQMLYKCPKCLSEFTMEEGDGLIRCSNCGLEVKIDNKFNLTYPKGTFMPSTISKWGEWERRMMRKAVEDPNFSITERVRLGVLPDYKYIKKTEHSTYAGEGYLTIDRTGFTYKGTRMGEDVVIHIDSLDIFTVVMSVDMVFFYTYNHKSEYLDFEPLDRISGLKLLLAIEETHRVNGGKWQHFPWFDYDNMTEGFIETK